MGIPCPVAIRELALDAKQDLVGVGGRRRRGRRGLEIDTAENIPRRGCGRGSGRITCCDAATGGTREGPRIEQIQQPSRQRSLPIVRNRRLPHGDRGRVAAAYRRGYVAVGRLRERGQIVVDFDIGTAEHRTPCLRRGSETLGGDLRQVTIGIPVHAGDTVAVVNEAHHRPGIVQAFREREWPAVRLKVDLRRVGHCSGGQLSGGNAIGREQRLQSGVRGPVQSSGRDARDGGSKHLTRRKSRRLQEAADLVLRIRPAVDEEITIFLQDGFALVPLDAEHHVALGLTPIDTEQRREARFVTVACGRDAGLKVHVDAFEVFFQHEVDDTCESVGAVHGGGATRNRLDTLDGGGRNGTEVNDQRCVRRLRTAAIDQYERAVGADTAQVHAGDAQCHSTRRLSGGIELRAIRHELRHLVEDAFDTQRAAVLQALGIDRHDRARRVQVPADDARPRDRNLFQRLGLRLLWLLRVRRHHPRHQGGNSRREQSAIDHYRLVTRAVWHCSGPPIESVFCKKGFSPVPDATNGVAKKLPYFDCRGAAPAHR